MKKVLTILIFGITTGVMAQTNAPQWSDSCKYLSDILGLPSYYCACSESSTTFEFPLETEVNDTVWYTATANDLRQGISAYWFADCSVTMEVYAFCTSKVPTVSLTVGANRMYEMDAELINKKLDEMGETAQLMAKTLTPHMRVYPNNGGSGRVYCYPFDQGPHSTCDDPLPLIPRMVYVCNHEENVYRMDAANIPASGKAFVSWIQKANKACEVWLTMDSCSGEEVGREVLTDSLHVFQPNAQMLTETRNADRSLWLHVKHENGVVGRITWYNNPKYADPLESVNKDLCSGKKVEFSLRTYTTDTVFTDTVWVAHDTLTTRDVNLTFTQPVTEYDTVYVTQADLNRGYVYSLTGEVYHAFGDYDIWVKKSDGCMRHIVLSLVDKNAPQQGLEMTNDIPLRAVKKLQNGQMILLINEQKYNLLGQKIN